MKRYTAGTIVPPGLYVSARPCEVRVVSCRAGLLEGGRGMHFVRVPGAAIPLVAALGLVLGGFYVLLFPLVGAATIAGWGAVRAWRSLRDAVAGHPASGSNPPDPPRLAGGGSARPGAPVSR
jgi:hypothetical protein